MVNKLPNALLNRPGFLDELVEVFNDWDVQRGRTRFHPVFTQLVAVFGMDWSDGVAEVVKQSCESVKPPAFTSLTHPTLAVVLEWAE